MMDYLRINKEEAPQANRLSEIMIKMYHPKSVGDFGCATGLYLKPFMDRGIAVHGYENCIDAVSDDVRQIPIECIILRDVTTITSRIKKADVSICLEVLEHVHPGGTESFIDKLTESSDTIVFSAAVPGQGGDGHINCRPKEDWQDLFLNRGFERDELDETEILTFMKKGEHMGWLIQNLMVFKRKGKMRFHVVNLPHTQTTKEYLPCAYTQKVVNFCRMMKSLGHEVFLYASEDNDAPCDEFITCITKDEQIRYLPANDWKKNFFDLQWSSEQPYWKIMNASAVLEISKRIRRKDFICLIGGNCQRPIASSFPGHISVEFGIGYEGTFSKFRVFESYAWMHYIYGKQGQGNGQYYDAVIPNYFCPEDFKSEPPEDYYFFIGRLISRKGVHIAAEVCNRLGVKLIMAGQGVLNKEPGKITAQEIIIEGDNIEHVGTVDAAQRADLMSKALAVFVPTQYIGPFEGVHAEAMMCGTPVITTDWGVFSETVEQGVDGYRCRTLFEFMDAAKKCKDLDRDKIKERANARFSIDSVKFKYQEYFNRLLNLWGDGWYAS